MYAVRNLDVVRGGGVHALWLTNEFVNVSELTLDQVLDDLVR